MESVSYYLNCTASDDTITYEREATAGIITGRGNRSAREKPAPGSPPWDAGSIVVGVFSVTVFELSPSNICSKFQRTAHNWNMSKTRSTTVQIVIFRVVRPYSLVSGHQHRSVEVWLNTYRVCTSLEERVSVKPECQASACGCAKQTSPRRPRLWGRVHWRDGNVSVTSERWRKLATGSTSHFHLLIKVWTPPTVRMDVYWFHRRVSSPSPTNYLISWGSGWWSCYSTRRDSSGRSE
jgi:hypothetical protein